MNRLIAVFFMGWLLASCSSGSTTVESALPGQYFREGGDSSASFKQTLTIAKNPGQADNVFTVESKSLERRLDDNNKPIEKPEETESFTGIYHADKKLLELVEKGSYYSVDLENGKLTNGKVTFDRVK
ncbi:hypothetical protein [Niastella sp. OAS944]|uniref:hypothetical protein n=1 Tax=Niastella sp. OAS944 TaxID=2664089 RepID=UPI0034831F1C|nr:hypothetical protein [Chitinophagaceae bacterium OAS944]